MSSIEAAIVDAGLASAILGAVLAMLFCAMAAKGSREEILKGTASAVAQIRAGRI
jgi:hypothetical protein